jgi:threonine dehydrogenase-like Zn-dependent dehydrogenase
MFISIFRNNTILLLIQFVVVETARPRIIDEGDIILKVTGSTICGSDLHLFHGMSSMLAVNGVSLDVLMRYLLSIYRGHPRSPER